MKQEFSSNPHELAQAKITFWFYAGSIPIIIFLLFVLPAIRKGAFTFSIFTIAYAVLILVLLYLTYRAYRVMHAIQTSRCTLTAETISGVSTPDPFHGSETFTIRREEILGIAKKQINISMTRFFNAIVLNTQNKQYVLFAIERPEELLKELQS